MDEDETVSIKKPDKNEPLKKDGGRYSPDEQHNGEGASKTGHEAVEV